MRVEVLRLGHRPARDKRVTTHVLLTARALGAVAARIAEKDESIAKTVAGVSKRFGGEFPVATGTGWRKPVVDWKAHGGIVVHLTMYGIPLAEGAAAVKLDGRDVLVVVGAEKVPGDLYELADWNVAVGNQPHSEVAALALLLDRLRGGAWERDTFPGAKMRVVPSSRAKRIETP